MSPKTARGRAPGGRAPAPATPPGIDWPVTALAAAGVLVAAYLTWTKLASATPLLCEVGSGCDVVQASRWATLLGVPTALWGALAYAAVGGLAILGFTAGRWQAAFVLASAGLAFSGYLTYVSLAVIGAACVYCLASTAIMLALVGVLVWRRPTPTRRSPLRLGRVAVLGAVTAVVTVVGAIGVFDVGPGRWGGRETDLARHLAATGAVMYGAYWCPACQEQKARFGPAAADVPYVECDPKAAGAQPARCEQAAVRRYPTWVVQGERREGVLTLDELARLSSFRE